MGMIITRRPGEAVRVGEALVTVVRLRNGNVKLRVDAPAETLVAPVLDASRAQEKTKRDTAASR
jgi:sRNA-binding carbon storage regulator CsrA